MKPKTIILILAALIVVLLFVFCGREIIAANEPKHWERTT
jgi:hypothetical protein